MTADFTKNSYGLVVMESPGILPHPFSELC